MEVFLGLDNDEFEMHTPESSAPTSPNINAVDLQSVNSDLVSSSIPPEKNIGILEKPFVGMEFTSLESAKEYYKEYGRQEGFCIRTRGSAKRQWGVDEKTTAFFVCSREGKHESQRKDNESSRPTIKRNTSAIKCGCKAGMRVLKKRDNDRWEVTLFNDVHNHKPVTPSKRMCMKVNKVMPGSAKSLLNMFKDENLPVGKIASVFGGDMLGFDDRDCWNHLNATRKKLKEGDATGILNFFTKKNAENPQFFYNIQLDDERRAVNLFWVDGRSRMQYQYFGDVVCFDTTYKTNVYQMPFAPFTGVNHHGQSIQFGCALLLDETEQTFMWVFDAWLRAMGGCPPTSIITDADKAMGNAIAKVLPSTRHRLCLWHVMKKFPEKLSHIYQKELEFKKDMDSLMHGVYTEYDFEVKWDEMLTKYNLRDNSWLKKKYEERAKWVPVYHLNTFYAGMNTSGRSESMNSFYDGYITSKTTLTDFAYANEKGLERIAMLEMKEDYKTEHTNRIVPEAAFLLQHASKVYTRNLLDKFKKEWEKEMNNTKVDLEVVDKTNDWKMYTLRARNSYDKKEWKVNLNKKTFEGNCDCKCFEFKGYPCSHILKVFMRLDIDEIPDHFILKRWMQGANTYRMQYGGGLVVGHQGSEALRLAHSAKVANQLVFDAAGSDETYTVLIEGLNELSIKISERKKKLASENVGLSMTSNDVEPRVDVSQLLILNPNISQTKGRNKEVNTANLSAASTSNVAQSNVEGRYKGGLENALNKKDRKCAFCKRKGVNHDIRNCPDKPKNE